MGKADRLIRVALAFAVAVLWFSGGISGAVGVVLAIVAVVFLATAAFGVCPLYIPFGLSTRKATPGAVG